MGQTMTDHDRPKTTQAHHSPGAREVQDAASFVGNLLDEELRGELLQEAAPGSSSRTRVSILCSALYSMNASLEECLHWIPGWFGCDLPAEVDGLALVNKVISQTEAATFDRVAQLQEQTIMAEKEEDEAILNSLVDEIEIRAVAAREPHQSTQSPMARPQHHSPTNLG